VNAPISREAIGADRQHLKDVALAHAAAKELLRRQQVLCARHGPINEHARIVVRWRKMAIGCCKSLGRSPLATLSERARQSLRKALPDEVLALLDREAVTAPPSAPAALPLRPPGPRRLGIKSDD
jgi:hypothetical protein